MMPVYLILYHTLKQMSIDLQKKIKKFYLTKQELYDILYIILYILLYIYYIIYYIIIFIYKYIYTHVYVRMYARSACKHPVEQATCEALAELVIAFKRIIRGLEGLNGCLGIPR